MNMRILGIFVLACTASIACAAPVVQKSFATPEEGAAALYEAVKANDAAAMRVILGPGGSKLIRSGDTVADGERRNRFVAAYGEGMTIARTDDGKATLVIGKDEWPLPIPLVSSKAGWRFDTKKGRDEILKRRIGANELAAMQVCLAIVDAEREYVARDQDGNGILEYAAKIVSAPSRHDGLYWESGADGKASPLGPLVAAAAKEGYAGRGALALAPYHGYYYRILTGQGKDAKGGAYDYRVKGKLIGGFAVLAYPARHGSSGIMTFVVDRDGTVYERDLGKDTAALAARIAAFNPDAGWKQAEIRK
jgi:Protein of unknown function (DUF2950)